MDELPEEEKPGIPAWVVTFADLMSLLMCFFVLLLSFSEIDAQKFKQIAGELSKAFGVQRDVPALEIPKGTSPIFDKFSPAPPEPTVVNEVKQTTTDEAPELQTLKSPTDMAVEAAMEEQMQETMDDILKVLEPAIADGRINVSEDQRRIVIRVEEKGSFPSGSAQLTWEFEGLLLDMAEVIDGIPGDLTMAVALLTTLYGAMIATMFATPIADKLSLRMTEEARMQSLYIDALVAIQEGTNPRIIEQMLSSYLPPKEREKVAEAEGA